MVLFVALVSLVAAAGFMVALLRTGQTAWAWASIAVSAVAAAVLVVRWWRLRRVGQHRAAAPDDDGADATVGPDGGPVEEDTDAADLLVVCGLSDEVLVVDEYPRYHLGTCRWLQPRPAERLPVREARNLGFTPCARCGPDAELAGRHRASSAG